MSKGTKKIKQTKDEQRLGVLLDALADLCLEKIEDIETGVEDGTYEDDEDNKNEVARLNGLLTSIDEERENRPKVYLFMEGGLIQGVSASRTMDWNQYDNDDGSVDADYVAANGTCDEWDAKVEKLTKEGIIRPLL